MSAAFPIDRDEDGAPLGFLVGKSAALADWHFKKEREAFRRMCAVLSSKKWAEENRERRRVSSLRYALKPESKRRANERARARRAAKPVPVLICRECQRPHVKRGRRGGTVPEFCSDRCRQRFRYQERTPGARRIKRRTP